MKFPVIKGFDEAAFHKYLKNTGWLMSGKIMALLVNLMVTRYLGPTLFGDLSFALALIAITGAIGALGLDTFIIREIINEPTKTDEILGTALGLRLMVNTLFIPISIGIYLAYHHWFENQSSTLTLMVALLSLTSVFKSFNVIDAYFQSQVQSKPVVVVQNICLFITVALKIIVVVFGLPLLYLVLVYVIDALILAVGLIIVYQKKGSHILSWTFNKLRGAALLKLSFPLVLSAVMVSLYMKIDLLMLKPMGSAVAGIYGAAATLSEAWYFIPTAIITSVFPAIINARKTDLERYQKRLGNLYDLLMWISLPVAVFTSVFGDLIVDILYPDKYYGAGAMLSIHIWSGIFVFLGVASSQYLLAEGYTKISFYRTATGAVANVLLNLWLIPLYGGVGASIATLVACFISTFYVLLLRKTRKQGIMMLKSLFLVSAFQKILKR